MKDLSEKIHSLDKLMSTLEKIREQEAGRSMSMLLMSSAQNSTILDMGNPETQIETITTVN